MLPLADVRFSTVVSTTGDVETEGRSHSSVLTEFQKLVKGNQPDTAVKAGYMPFTLNMTKRKEVFCQKTSPHVKCQTIRCKQQ